MQIHDLAQIHLKLNHDSKQNRKLRSSLSAPPLLTAVLNELGQERGKGGEEKKQTQNI